MDIIRNFNDMDLKRVLKIWYEGNLEAHDFIDPSYWDRNFNYTYFYVFNICWNFERCNYYFTSSPY